jgi:hypothetical protein
VGGGPLDPGPRGAGSGRGGWLAGRAAGAGRRRVEGAEQGPAMEGGRGRAKRKQGGRMPTIIRTMQGEALR